MLVSKLVALSLILPIQYQVPTECINIANREGYGLVIETKKELFKAKARLVYLRLIHPLDKEIRACDKVVNELVKGLPQH